MSVPDATDGKVLFRVGDPVVVTTHENGSAQASALEQAMFFVSQVNEAEGYVALDGNKEHGAGLLLQRNDGGNLYRDLMPRDSCEVEEEEVTVELSDQIEAEDASDFDARLWRGFLMGRQAAGGCLTRGDGRI